VGASVAILACDGPWTASQCRSPVYSMQILTMLEYANELSLRNRLPTRLRRWRDDRRRLQFVGVFRELLAKDFRQRSVMQNIHVRVVLPDVVVFPRFVPPAKTDHRRPAPGK